MLKDKMKVRRERTDRLRKRIRDKVRGTGQRPRVHVHKSNLYIYTQAVDDSAGRILVAASTLEKEFREKAKNTKNKDASALLGGLLAQRLKEKKIDQIVFDRGDYPYHGRVKALAEALRKEGIRF